MEQFVALGFPGGQAFRLSPDPGTVRLADVQ